MRDLGERPGERRHLHYREGDPGLRVQDEDDNGGPQGLRHRDPGGFGGLKNMSFESKFYTFVYLKTIFNINEVRNRRTFVIIYFLVECVRIRKSTFKLV